MEDMTERAFLSLQLLSAAPGKLDEFRVYEKSLHMPRYLFGFEMLKWIKAHCPLFQVNQPPSSEIETVDSMWRKYDWEKPWKIFKPEDTWAWEDFFLENYQPDFEPVEMRDHQ